MFSPIPQIYDSPWLAYLQDCWELLTFETQAHVSHLFEMNHSKGSRYYQNNDLFILRGRAGYELIYITNEAVGRVGYYQLISGKSEKNNCFSKFSSNSLDFFGWNLLKSWHFLYRRRREKIFSDLQNFSTRNSPSVFPYLVKLNDNGSYHGLREPIRKLGNHYPELKIYEKVKSRIENVIYE